jgi:DNA gyrase subunit A
MGRNATGVRAISLDKDNDAVVGMVIINDIENTDILVVSENGFGKRSDVSEYRITNRGGKGVKTIQITDKTGSLIAIREVNDTDDLMIMTKEGITIRMPVEEIREAGRATQGVRLIRLRDSDAIASITRIAEREEENNEEVGGEETSAPSEGTENSGTTSAE